MKFFNCYRFVASTGLLVWILVSSTYADSEDPVAKGLQIAQDTEDFQAGFENYVAKQTMILRDRKGRESTRNLRVKVLESEDSGKRILFIFDEPRDVRGTTLLIHSNPEEQDDQWIFLPALQRVKRLNSRSQSSSFMGSEFSYEDMNPPEVGKFTYEYLRDEIFEERECTVIERVPVSDGSAYSRQVVWQDKTAYRLWKVEYFDRKGDHLKTLTVSGYEQYLDHYWQAQSMTMTNHVNGKSTTIDWSEYEFRVDLDDSDFTQTSLRRTR